MITPPVTFSAIRSSFRVIAVANPSARHRHKKNLSPSLTVLTLVNKDYLLRFEVSTIIDTHLINKNRKKMSTSCKLFAYVQLH